ncbi:MAG TPA: hypothetical protein RMH85_35455 [Polyangiaceae bacterium LLY-WYZ-15_(1-7)]|nr:hypothetical protein [Polyangiaceae bacterium LLY-WYZ-15_(1-7)]HJL05883.1 hypothetical protein [Polyangiaceae bacterium LLY-WYZ-15_(1-7)]HJL13838.1 hypothetical protein [Polyangiaceae bacterium LLY-WYZ-15_(1-7)]HJL21768.1 hypothetical protein [Polyangiaceae bacterium LLY-WYZ-15_(1-7)]HJL30036.1 hypothetical protein [Polyangiaceae bacterium LLY-WYZ-15_(1-7)]
MWRVEFDPEARLLSIRLHEHVTPRDVRDLGRAHTQALACTAGQPFRALLDLRRLFPLEGEAVELLTALKKACVEHEGFAGMVVLADSPTVAMQQHHTRVRSGTNPEIELVTLDEAQARGFLARAL